jgi:hypothetical protein
MTTMTEGEREAWIAALTRRLRRLARGARSRGPALAAPDAAGREPPAGPARGAR